LDFALGEGVDERTVTPEAGQQGGGVRGKGLHQVDVRWVGFNVPEIWKL
jgi:hypothetical protein